jgi:hypothetical protein
VDGKPAGNLPELRNLNIELGTDRLTINGQQAQTIQIGVPAWMRGPVRYKLTMSSPDGVVQGFQTKMVEVLYPPPVSIQPKLKSTLRPAPATSPGSESTAKPSF